MPALRTSHLISDGSIRVDRHNLFVALSYHVCLGLWHVRSTIGLCSHPSHLVPGYYQSAQGTSPYAPPRANAAMQLL